INMPSYRDLPVIIKRFYCEIINELLQLINDSVIKADTQLITNSLKIWIMVNKILLCKIERGGKRASDELLNRIKNIKRGKIMIEWEKLLIKWKNFKHMQSNRPPNKLLNKDEQDLYNIKRCQQLAKRGNVYKGIQGLKS